LNLDLGFARICTYAEKLSAILFKGNSFLTLQIGGHREGAGEGERGGKTGVEER
jgi:hypothetical protein